jgi:predicted ATPase
VAALVAKIRLRRFVTLVGPGGVGKTVVAPRRPAAIAADVGRRRLRRPGLVQQPALVPSALASALGLPARQDDPTGELADHLAGRRLLLVLDSCEHVVDAVARLTECIVAKAPQVHLCHQPRALALPRRMGHSARPAGVAAGRTARSTAATAGGLRCSCSSSVPPRRWTRSASTTSNAGRVAAICRQLDGMPLAIELAAARVDRLRLQGLQAMLDDRLGLLLAAGRRGAQARSPDACVRRWSGATDC